MNAESQWNGFKPIRRKEGASRLASPSSLEPLRFCLPTGIGRKIAVDFSRSTPALAAY